MFDQDRKGEPTVMDEPARTLDTPHSHALAMIRAAATLDANPDHQGSLRILASGVDALTALLDGDRRPDWAWFEIVVGEGACRLPEALICAGQVLRREDALALGLSTLEWMLAQGRCPAETMAEACEAAFAATGDPAWQVRAASKRAVPERRASSYAASAREAAA